MGAMQYGPEAGVGDLPQLVRRYAKLPRIFDQPGRQLRGPACNLARQRLLLVREGVAVADAHPATRKRVR